MIIKETIKRLEKIEKQHGDFLHVTSNRINGVSCLIIKNHAGEILECVVLEDTNFKRRIY